MRKEVEANGTAQSTLGFGLKEIHGSPETIYVVDTNVLVSDSNTVENLQDNGTNAVVIPWIVLSELDNLKTKQDLSRQVGDAVKKINHQLHIKDPNLYITQGNIKKYLDLDPKNPDHHIIATCLDILEGYSQIPLVLVSNDAMVHTVGMRLGIKVEEYKEDQVSRIDFEKPLPKFCTDEFKINENGHFIISGSQKDFPVLHNGGAVLHSYDYSTIFPVIRKDNLLIPIRSDINAMGITPMSKEEEPNWAQYVALYQLLDPTISIVTLHGEAGTGKTLLPIAAAIKQLIVEEKTSGPVAGRNMEDELVQSGFAGVKGFYRKIYIARPFIHLGDKDPMGYFPGDIDAKSFHWLFPIYDNIAFIASLSNLNEQRIKKINEAKILEILPLSLIRGRTLTDSFILVDETQNVNRKEMKAIVTRVGEGTKLVLVGDINQIDIRWLEKKSSGLTHVTVKMSHLLYFANTFLNQTVRSQMAKDAAALL